MPKDEMIGSTVIGWICPHSAPGVSELLGGKRVLVSNQRIAEFGLSPGNKIEYLNCGPFGVFRRRL